MITSITKEVRVTMLVTTADLVQSFADMRSSEQIEFFRSLADRADALGLSIEELAAVRVLAGLPVEP